jgi:hypothetical protein
MNGRIPLECAHLPEQTGSAQPIRSGWAAIWVRGPTTSLDRVGSGVPAQIDCWLSTYAEVEWFRHRNHGMIEVADLLRISRVSGGWVFRIGRFRSARGRSAQRRRAERVLPIATPSAWSDATRTSELALAEGRPHPTLAFAYAKTRERNGLTSSRTGTARSVSDHNKRSLAPVRPLSIPTLGYPNSTDTRPRTPRCGSPMGRKNRSCNPA